jgi:hypothetical protein
MTPFDVGELASRIGLPDEAAADERPGARRDG